MDNNKDPFIVRLAEDMSEAFKAPWWKFWSRRTTQREAFTAIQLALAGDAKPIRRFGIAVPAPAPRIVILNRIMEQVARIQHRNRGY